MIALDFSLAYESAILIWAHHNQRASVASQVEGLHVTYIDMRGPLCNLQKHLFLAGAYGHGHPICSLSRQEEEQTFFSADPCCHDLCLWMLLLAVVVYPATRQVPQRSSSLHMAHHIAAST